MANNLILAISFSFKLNSNLNSCSKMQTKRNYLLIHKPFEFQMAFVLPLQLSRYSRKIYK